MQTGKTAVSLSELLLFGDIEPGTFEVTCLLELLSVSEQLIQQIADEGVLAKYLEIKKHITKRVLLRKNRAGSERTDNGMAPALTMLDERMARLEHLSTIICEDKSEPRKNEIDDLLKPTLSRNLLESINDHISAVNSNLLLIKESMRDLKKESIQLLNVSKSQLTNYNEQISAELDMQKDMNLENNKRQIKEIQKMYTTRILALENSHKDEMHTLDMRWHKRCEEYQQQLKNWVEQFKICNSLE
ncbi:hypothetical protein PCE1_002789 [Barthelona sp. PCE]